jgi:hypothetical protein
MRRPKFQINQLVFSTLYADVKEGFVEEIIYTEPIYTIVHYLVVWEDGSYRREPESRLSETQIKF